MLRERRDQRVSLVRLPGGARAEVPDDDAFVVDAKQLIERLVARVVELDDLVAAGHVAAQAHGAGSAGQRDRVSCPLAGGAAGHRESRCRDQRPRCERRPAEMPPGGRERRRRRVLIRELHAGSFRSAERGKRKRDNRLPALLGAGREPTEQWR